jgi:DNA adenine methylase
MTTFVRWAGSKRLLLPLLCKCVPHNFERYVEPFVGSGALFFALRPRRALLSDINDELITTFRAVRNDPDLVLQALRRMPVGSGAYYKIRSTQANDAAPAIRAARFLYLNRYCFNGLYRTNAAGAFNVPYGPPKRPLVGFEDRLKEGASILKTATLLSADFGAVASLVNPGDFVYLDPPYAVDNKRIFREYLPGSFSSLDLPRLEHALHQIDSVGARFLLSYVASPEAAQLAGGWHQKTVTVRRNVAGFSGNRRQATEVLVSNHPFSD